MHYQYSALNADRKPLNGTLEANSEVDARNTLKSFGFSILEIKPFENPTAGAVPSSLKKFSFEGRDTKERKVMGTIEAETDAEAFEKLTLEYGLSVTQLYREGASDEGKNGAQNRLAELQQSSSNQKMKLGKVGAEEEEVLKKDHDELMKTVTGAIQTVQTFLSQYEHEMKLEDRETLQNYLNQLLRIKDSTNLPHIRRTCEILLDYMQKQEISIVENQRIREEMMLKAQSQELLEQLQKTGLKKEISLLGFAEKLSTHAIFSPIGRFLLRTFFVSDPEILEVMAALKVAQHRIFEFIKMFFFPKNARFRKEILENIREILAERKRLKLLLAALKQKHRDERRAARAQEQLETWDTWPLLVGWLLAFYLGLYFVTFTVPTSFDFQHSPLLQSILIVLFAFHGISTLKKYYLPNRPLTNALLYPVATFSVLLFLFNFVL